MAFCLFRLIISFSVAEGELFKDRPAADFHLECAYRRFNASRGDWATQTWYAWLLTVWKLSSRQMLGLGLQCKKVGVKTGIWWIDTEWKESWIGTHENGQKRLCISHHLWQKTNKQTCLPGLVPISMQANTTLEKLTKDPRMSWRQNKILPY